MQILVGSGGLRLSHSPFISWGMRSVFALAVSFSKPPVLCLILSLGDRWICGERKTLNNKGCFCSSAFVSRLFYNIRHDVVLSDGDTAAADYYTLCEASCIKMSRGEVRHGTTTYRRHDRCNPERESGGIPGSVAPGSRGMKRMGPIQKVPLKRRSYTNRDWHEERRQVVFTYTGSFVSVTKGITQTVRSENRQNLMRLFFISGDHCLLIGSVCMCN